MFEKLNDSNFLLYAAKSYYNRQCYSIEEFNEDLNRIKYIKKLITRYIETQELKERLILNHLVILNNVFETEALIRMIFLKLENYMEYIKPFILFLNIMPEKVYGIKSNKVIETDNIKMDPYIISALRRI